MTYVITQNCCNDSSCVSVCPVNCIHPTPGEPGFATTEMLYIDPEVCIDCGACVDACPVGAIAADFDLTSDLLPFADLNAQYYRDPEHQGYSTEPYTEAPRERVNNQQETLSVAVVGSGPAAMFAVEELVSWRGLDVKVDVIERLMTPWGLVRHGVAPDHESTKDVATLFTRTASRKNVRFFFDTEVGRDVTHDELAASYHAVIYAVGAADGRLLDIDGCELPGSTPAAEFVGWYNGHPDDSNRSFDLSHERAVVLGNGNVALDVARILLSDVDRLRKTDIAEHALDALAASKVREVVVVGRRGPREAAFTTPELLGLSTHPDFTLVAPRQEIEPALADEGTTPALSTYKVQKLVELTREDGGAERQLVFRFGHSPVGIMGDEAVAGIRLDRNRLLRGADGGIVVESTGKFEELECGLVVHAVGHQGREVAGVSFDHAHGVIPNELGRVVDPESGQVLPGAYAAGWIKRGPRGVIGTNRGCAAETASALVEDWLAGSLQRPTADDLAGRGLSGSDFASWKRIDAQERRRGQQEGRARVKLIDRSEQYASAQENAGSVNGLPRSDE